MKQVTYQCQAIGKNGERCKSNATHFTNNKNLCPAHHWQVMASKQGEKK